MSTTLGQRICVVGTSGCGKTHVAEALATRLGIPYICNYAIIWRPNWQPTPDEERLADMKAATAQPAWTFDGNLGASPDDQIALANCDTIVWLDLPRWKVHSQVLFRTLKRLVSREPLWHNNIETWRMLFSSDSIVWWSLKTFGKRRRLYKALFANPDFENKARIRLTSRREVTRWLASLPQQMVEPEAPTAP